MAATYYLICSASCQALCLGKFILYDKDLNSIPPQFGGWIDERTEAFITHSDLTLLIERFILLNIGKDIRLVITDDLAELDPDGTWKEFGSFDDLMQMKLPSPFSDP